MINAYINIALDSFALVVLAIIFLACINEHVSRKGNTSKPFMSLLSFIAIALSADLISWIAEGHVELSWLIITSNTVASCASYVAIICFMCYLRENLLEKTKLLSATIWIFGILGVASIIIMLSNAFNGFVYEVDELGHYVRIENFTMSVLYLLFPLLSLLVTVLIVLLAQETPKNTRIPFIIYAVFPMVGVILDYSYHGLSLTYIGLVVSVLIIYTNIYYQKQRLIEKQKTALMMSQINPHFMYNTLSTIASMCDISPKQAKNLTIDFSTYLRQNISTLTTNDLISFEQEMKHVECYLKIEKARFGDRLNVLYSTQCQDFYLPALTIQPLVENAVKHGITKKSRGGTIRILSYSTEYSYIVEIIDDGVGFDTSKRLDDGKEHIGFENVKKRISRMCKGNVAIKSTVGVGTRVTVDIPKKKGK